MRRGQDAKMLKVKERKKPVGMSLTGQACQVLPNWCSQSAHVAYKIRLDFKMRPLSSVSGIIKIKRQLRGVGSSDEYEKW